MSKVMRSIKNVTKGYSSAQIKVRNATSNDPWGPTGTEMSEIAQMISNSTEEYYEVMDMLDKRLNDKGKNWRHPLKALKVLDYALHEGSELVVTWARKNIYIIKALREFQYLDEDGIDVGQHVRRRARELTDLILDDERLHAGRQAYKRIGTYKIIPDATTGSTQPQREQHGDEENPTYLRSDTEASKYPAEAGSKAHQSRQAEPDDENVRNPLAAEEGDVAPKMSATYMPTYNPYPLIAMDEPIQPRDNDPEVILERSRAVETKRQHEIQVENGARGTQVGESAGGSYAEARYTEIGNFFDDRIPSPYKSQNQYYTPEIQPPKAKFPTANGVDRIWKDRNMDQDQQEVRPQPITNSQRRTVQVEHVPPHTPRVHHQPVDDDERRPVKVEHVRSNSQTQRGEQRPAENSEKNDNLPVANPIDLHTVETLPEVGPSTSPLEPQTTASTGNSTFSSTTTEMKLGDYFKDRGERPEIFTDLQCGEIARLLVQSGNPSWSTAPRIYIILRLIGQLQRFDAFLDHGINDLWLPFSKASLPSSLDLVYHEEFLKQQTVVLTKAINLENGSKGHAHFTRNDPFPFEVRETLGEGGFGYVDKIVSPLSGRVFARKRFRRPRGQKKTELESFMNELKILKRLHHIHCVSLVGSYTDPKYFGIIIAPVADCDLAAFYSTVTTETTPILRSFFGCLANAINFLHEAKIRHRDIKPQNILVKGSSVYLTDFGISLDWENLSRSTTTKDTAKSMLYCAPEVARYEKRNTSADIWSLGCVFLEMLTIINGKTLEEQRSLFKQQSGNYRFFDNTSTARDWTRQLRRLQPENEPDDLMSDIILEMLQESADDRILTAILCDKLSRYQPADKTQSNPLCAECCIVDSLSISDSGSDRDPFEVTT